MKRRQFLAIFLAMICVTACESDPIKGDYIAVPPRSLPVTLTIQSDNQGLLREFPLKTDNLDYRSYIEATPNDRYRLHIVNNSDQRVGLVIAVDGRNIISGKKSWLANTERMYILNPHESSDYEGWRSSKDQTNRFYFTNASDSYAAAWGDSSAMGVIAMAVYPEYSRPPVVINKTDDERSAESTRGFEFKSRLPASTMPAAPTAGTGFGENTYSPSTSVAFEPSKEAIEKVFLKYEWRDTLCRKGIIRDCRVYDNKTNNRFWQDEVFAPPPPKH